MNPSSGSHFDPASSLLGNYSSFDGTVEFYGRINALLRPDYCVVDLGAGRGAWWSGDKAPYRRELRRIRGKVAKFIGADVDPVVLQNPTTDENILIQEGAVPLPANSVEMVICDFVFEHILDPERFRCEVDRILKPGGYLCARTPHALNYVTLAARLIRNSQHARWLAMVQPSRQAQDVFPTAYRLNTLRAVEAQFAGWHNYSYVYPTEPSYYFGQKWMHTGLSLMHKFMPNVVSGNIFAFLQKPF